MCGTAGRFSLSLALETSSVIVADCGTIDVERTGNPSADVLDPIGVGGSDLNRFGGRVIGGFLDACLRARRKHSEMIVSGGHESRNNG